MKVLVCGGRYYSNRQRLFEVLDEIDGPERCIRTIIEGEATGADQLSALWASQRGRRLKPFPADWNKLGVAAGPIRNRQMLIEGQPDLVVAFPGKGGTLNMVRQTVQAGVNLRIVDGWLILDPTTKMWRPVRPLGDEAEASS